jgi:hypothetical protein
MIFQCQKFITTKTISMKLLSITITLLCIGFSTNAQVYNDGALANPGGLISDWSTQYISTATGTYSTAGSTGGPSNYGVFEHRGQSGTGAAAAMVNNGSYDASTFGRDYFMGPDGTAGQQEISGSIAPVFTELFIQNGAGSQFNVTNIQGINVGQRIDFANGITTTVRSNTEAGAVRLLDNATYTNTVLGDAQHVNGYVSKMGDDAFTFPVGSGTDLRSLSISAPATPTDQYSVAWMVGDPTTNGDPSDANAMHSTASVTGPIASVSMAGQWDWIPVSGTGAGLTITVSIPDLSPTGVLAADLRLVGWNGTAWIDLSGGPNATGNTEGSSLSGTMIAGITAIGIGSISVELPVTFNDFNVTQKGCTAELNWNTSMEKNNDYFQVERSSDGRNFKAIGSEDAKGNSDVLQNYVYTDNAPLPGTNFYRIAQVDLDGKRTTTGIENVYFSCESAGIKVYPTISNGTVYVSLPEGYEQATLSVFNVLSQQLNLSDTDNGQRLRTIQLNGLSAGTYFLKVTHGNAVESYKIIHKP